jgi:hypothetical protein
MDARTAISVEAGDQVPTLVLDAKAFLPSLEDRERPDLARTRITPMKRRFHTLQFAVGRDRRIGQQVGRLFRTLADDRLLLDQLDLGFQARREDARKLALGRDLRRLEGRTGTERRDELLLRVLIGLLAIHPSRRRAHRRASRCEDERDRERDTRAPGPTSRVRHDPTHRTVLTITKRRLPAATSTAGMTRFSITVCRSSRKSIFRS